MSKADEIEELSEEEKYKLALFMVIRNSTVMPKGLELGKTQKEINKMTYKTIQEIINMINFDIAKELYEEGVIVEEI